MTLRGFVKDGRVVLSGRRKLAEGTRVRVEPIDPPRNGTKKSNGTTQLGQRLMKFAGRVKGMPKDLARNHAHYAHGAAKK